MGRERKPRFIEKNARSCSPGLPWQLRLRGGVARARSCRSASRRSSPGWGHASRAGCPTSSRRRRAAVIVQHPLDGLRASSRERRGRELSRDAASAAL